MESYLTLRYLVGGVVGVFDIIVILLLVFINIRFWNKKWGCLIQILGTLLYVFVFPFISMGVEIQIVSKINGYKPIDSIELLYTWLRFPLYWILFILQLIVFGFKQRN